MSSRVNGRERECVCVIDQQQIEKGGQLVYLGKRERERQTETKVEGCVLDKMCSYYLHRWYSMGGERVCSSPSHLVHV